MKLILILLGLFLGTNLFALPSGLGSQPAEIHYQYVYPTDTKSFEELWVFLKENYSQIEKVGVLKDEDLRENCKGVKLFVHCLYMDDWYKGEATMYKYENGECYIYTLSNDTKNQKIIPYN